MKLFKKDLFALIGKIMSTTFVLIYLAYLLFVVVDGVNNGYLTQDTFIRLLFTNILNIVFYILLLLDFIKSENNLWYAYVAIIILTVSNYIIPLVNEILTGAILIDILSFSFSLIPLGLGIVYFIFTILERNNNKKKYYKLLLLFGILIFIFTILSSGSIVYRFINVLKMIGSEEVTYRVIIEAIFYIIVYVLEILTASLYILFPLKVKKERRIY